MKNLLIITQSFAPRNAVASIRFTKVAKYLARTSEYKIFVITETAPLGEPVDEILSADIEGVKDNVTVYAIDNQRLGKKLKNGKKNVASSSSGGGRFWSPGEKVSLKNRLKGRYLFHYQTVFRNKAYKKAEEIIAEHKIDAMVTTYGGIGATATGLKIKEKHPEIRWINDYRDPIRAKTPGIVRSCYKVATKADALCEAITGASSSYVGTNTHPEKFNVITNSCDPEDLSAIDAKPSEKFQLCFTGTFHPGKFEADTLCKMLSELIDEGVIDRDNVVIKLAGKSIWLITEAANRYGMGDVVEEVGFIPRKDAISMQKGSDILCFFLWNETGSNDIIAGKIMEYTMMDRPIVCFIRGDKGDSLMKHIILENSLGECYEEASKDADYDRVKAYVAELYREKMEKGVIVRQNLDEIKDTFSAKTMAEKFGELIG